MNTTQLITYARSAQSANTGAHPISLLPSLPAQATSAPISTAAATYLKTELEQRFEVPIRYLAYSHNHIDHVLGGDMLAGLTRVIEPWGNIACCGMAGGSGLHTTVFPMILRGVSLLGISSANCPIDTRRKLWDRLANEWKPPHLDEIVRGEVGLEGMATVFDEMLAGGSLGRTLVKIAEDA